MSSSFTATIYHVSEAGLGHSEARLGLWKRLPGALQRPYALWSPAHAGGAFVVVNHPESTPQSYITSAISVEDAGLKSGMPQEVEIPAPVNMTMLALERTCGQVIEISAMILDQTYVEKTIQPSPSR